MLFAPSLGLLTDSKRHFKHGKDSLSLLDSSVKRGHKGNHVAAAAAGAPAAARISGGAPKAPTPAQSPRPPSQAGVFPPVWHTRQHRPLY